MTTSATQFHGKIKIYFLIEGRNFRKVLWGYHPNFQNIDAVTSWTWHLVSLSSIFFSYGNFFINRLLLPFASATSIIGIMLLLSILFQLLSGFFLGWYYIPEPGLVVELREEMFNDTRFGAEVFYMHTRGVDVIMVLSYLHILKKNLFKKLCCFWVRWVTFRWLCFCMV